jgi:hypothetical protein
VLHAQFGLHEMMVLGLALRRTLGDTEVSHFPFTIILQSLIPSKMNTITTDWYHREGVRALLPPLEGHDEEMPL